ncbi:MAG: DUF4062 domain-containing protein [Candidatus Methanogranum gryphiswaldense]|nr:MAG: DUF4062 domain-containing protein [Candidatus Methanogranum sp. U3.2.1]
MADNTVKYQVFVSSTFTDLVEERMGVFQTLLDANCIPSGMELFAASPDDQFSYIKKVMDQCDYYVLIVGGRYGSCKDGKSYTEKEYEYALEKKIPVLVFIPENIEDMPSEKKEETEEGKIKYSQFIKRLTDSHHLRHWKNKYHLCLEVLKAIDETKDEKPAVGWIRGDTIPPEISKKYIGLIDENKELKENLLDINTKAPEGTEDLAKDDEIHEINCFLEIFQGDMIINEDIIKISLSWNELLKIFGFELISDLYDNQLDRLLENDFNGYYEVEPWNGYRITNIDQITKIIKMQFKALGIIEYEIAGNSLLWKYTPYGKYKFEQIYAIKSKK